MLQKALDCEEDIRLLIVSELLRGDPAKTLVNKHASHVWSKVGDKQSFPNDFLSEAPLDYGDQLDSSCTSYIRIVRFLITATST